MMSETENPTAWKSLMLLQKNFETQSQNSWALIVMDSLMERATESRMAKQMTSLRDAQIWSQNQRSSMMLTEKLMKMKMTTETQMMTRMISETEN